MAIWPSTDQPRLTHVRSRTSRYPRHSKEILVDLLLQQWGRSLHSSSSRVQQWPYGGDQIFSIWDGGDGVEVVSNHYNFFFPYVIFFQICFLYFGVCQLLLFLMNFYDIFLINSVIKSNEFGGYRPVATVLLSVEVVIDLYPPSLDGFSPNQYPTSEGGYHQVLSNILLAESVTNQ